MGRFAFIATIGMTLPLYFLPSVFAYMNRKRGLGVFVVLNVLLIGYFLVGVTGFMDQAGPGFGLPPLALDITLVLWLVMLHFSLRRDQPTPEELDEPVKLVEHDASWAQAYADESRRIVETLSLPGDSIEHIGSTAVPELPAKPVIDLMLGVEKLGRTRALLSRLEILGYQNLGEAGVPGRIYLRSRGGERDFNLHVTERGGEHWTNNLALRDLLRRNPEARARYASGKTKALESGGARLLGYSAAKQPLLAELLSQARAPQL